nr:skin secretory protein xP2-like [Aegilops tauschii subsp. strangulata]
MPVPRAPAPGILGPRPAGHQALFAAQNAAPYSGYGAPPPPAPAYGSAPAYGATAASAFGASPAPAYGGFYPPQVPPPWDPTLLAALHSAPSPSSYGGGGDWYMDSGATAHMTAHPGRPYTDGTPPM